MMKKINLNTFLLLFIITVMNCPQVYAAIAVDRNRVIYHEGDNNISIRIRNDNHTRPYLAKAWVADKKDNNTSVPLIATPMLQRVEPETHSFIRISPTALEKTLPKDRESLYYFSVLEIPTVSSSENVMQLALQTKVKLFYRPTALEDDEINFHMDKLKIHKVGVNRYQLTNASAFYLNIISFNDKNGQKIIKAIALPPFSEELVDLKINNPGKITIVNDFGSKMPFNLLCNSNECQPELKE
jgi:chaperone protein PapD